jgi:hypothetical protein
MACRELLLTLNRKGLITLPPRLTSANNEKRNRVIPVIEIDQTPLQGKPSNLPSVTLKLVRNTNLEPLYNSLVEQHHYLGYRQIVGNHLKYMAFIGDRPVACLGWPPARRAYASERALLRGLSNPAIPSSLGINLPKRKTCISWPITLDSLFYHGSL